MQNVFNELYVVDMAAFLYSLLHISGLCIYRIEDFLKLTLCIIIIIHHS